MAKAIITQYPHLKDPEGEGYVSIIITILYFVTCCNLCVVHQYLVMHSYLVGVVLKVISQPDCILSMSYDTITHSECA